MLVLIEGCDGTGKTTLAHDLGKRLLMPVYTQADTPLRGKTVDISQAEDWGVLNLAIATKCDVIFDRFFPSEYAYGHAYKRKLDEKLLVKMDRMLEDVEHLCVLLKHQSVEAFQARTDDEVPQEKWRTLDHAYERWRILSHCKWLVLDAANSQLANIESVMACVAASRGSKDQTYMGIAHIAARRSTCLSRRTGAVLLSAQGHVLATAYNGAPTGIPHQSSCQRLRSAAASGSALDGCNDVHAEENTIVQAALNGSSPAGGTLYCIHSPCHRCARMIINARITEVVYERLYGDKRAIEMFQQAGIRLRQIGE